MNSEESSSLNESFLKEARAGYDLSMENMLYNQAIFYAQAMRAESDYSPETSFLCAKAFYLSGQNERAFEILQPFIASNERNETSFPKPTTVNTLSQSGVYLYAVCYVQSIYYI